MASRLIVVALASACLVLAGLPIHAEDSEHATAIYGFSLEETVVVLIQGGHIVSELDVRGMPGRYLDLGRFTGMTGAVTDYDLRCYAQGRVSVQAISTEIPAGALELALVADDFAGTPPTWIDPGATGYRGAVSPPQSQLLFQGQNNVAGSTRFTLAARIDLLALPDGALTSGGIVSFTVTLMIVER